MKNEIRFEKKEGETPYLRLLGHNGDAIGASIEKLGGNQRTNVDGDLDALGGLHFLSSQRRNPPLRIQQSHSAKPNRHHRGSRSNPGTESWEILKLKMFAMCETCGGEDSKFEGETERREKLIRERNNRKKGKFKN